MSDSPYIIEVTEENFQSVILDGSMQQPVLIDFWASWCQPCQALMPLLAKLADEYQGKFILAKINTEEQQAIAAQFQIRSIPAVKLVYQGKLVDEFAGALPESEVRAFLDKHIPQEKSEADNALEQAYTLLMQGESDQAAVLIQQVLKAEPSNPQAILAFAKLKATLGDMSAATEALDSLPKEEQDKPEVAAMRAQMLFDHVASEAPAIEDLNAMLLADEKNSEARFQLAAQLVMQGQLETALEHLLVLMRSDREYGDDAARKAMIQVFDILGGDHPITKTYRTRMFNYLY
ncbi:MAG: co-chaperone YbbN [Chromatiales bacterium]|jgi:putative thioredoxin